LKSVSSVLHIVSLNLLTALAKEAGFESESTRTAVASGRKSFSVDTFLSTRLTNRCN
jgi:hypothetical protein